MSIKLGFADAVRQYGDYWRTGAYNALERRQPHDEKLVKAFILASGPTSDAIHERTHMSMLMRYREDYACGKAFSGKKP
jgi:hypothetical protein